MDNTDKGTVAQDAVISAVVVEEDIVVDANPPPSVPAPNAPAPAPTSNPVHAGVTHPRGAPPGGRWSKIRYRGSGTALLCCALCWLTGPFSCFGTCAFLCPIDQEEVYVVDGKVYDVGGVYKGKTSEYQFQA